MVDAPFPRDRCAVAAVLAVVVALGTGCGTAPTASIPNVDVSNALGPQNEATIAVDPRNPDVLLAGSNSFSEKTDRVYSSTDGGRTWQSRPGPPLAPGPHCRASDPGVGISASDPGIGVDARGRQYFSFLQCTGPGRSRVAVASRSGPGRRWRSVAVPGAGPVADKPALAVGSGRVYVVWIAHLPDGLRLVRLSASRDGGHTWSSPVRVNDHETIVFYPTVATASKDIVYVAWNELSGIALARSLDHGEHFQPQVSIPSGDLTFRSPSCGFPIPAQPTICVWPNPQLATDRVRGGLYITWSAPGGNGSLDVFARRLGGRTVQVNPPDGKTLSDQFWPAPAVDQSTGRLWVCFYDTTGDPTRVKAVYSCTASSDGAKTWAKPVRVAGVASNETERGAAKGYFGREYGDYEGLAVADGTAHPIWTDSRRLATLREETYTARLTSAVLK